MQHPLWNRDRIMQGVLKSTKTEAVFTKTEMNTE